MSFQLQYPSQNLVPFVKQYWSLTSRIPYGGKYIHRIIPNGLIELTFYLGNRPRVLDSQRDFNENSLITGHQSDYYEMEISGDMSLFSVSLHPHGAMALFGLPISELRDLNVPLQEVLDHRLDDLENDLYAAGSFDTQISIIENFLLELLKQHYDRYTLDRMAHSIGIINQRRGQVTIGSLAESACLSRKQFERSFLRYVGTSPKQLIKTVRFQYALYQRQQNQLLSLGDISFRSGYYDQPHMNADFKFLSGLTPKTYFSTCEPYSDYFS